MRKKKLVAILIASMSLSLAACGTPANNSSSTTEVASESYTEAADRIVEDVLSITRENDTESDLNPIWEDGELLYEELFKTYYSNSDAGKREFYSVLLSFATAEKTAEDDENNSYTYTVTFPSVSEISNIFAEKMIEDGGVAVSEDNGWARMAEVLSAALEGNESYETETAEITITFVDEEPYDYYRQLDDGTYVYATYTNTYASVTSTGLEDLFTVAERIYDIYSMTSVHGTEAALMQGVPDAVYEVTGDDFQGYTLLVETQHDQQTLMFFISKSDDGYTFASSTPDVLRDGVLPMGVLSGLDGFAAETEGAVEEAVEAVEDDFEAEETADGAEPSEGEAGTEAEETEIAEGTDGKAESDAETDETESDMALDEGISETAE